MVQTRFLARRPHITATSIAATIAGASTIYYQYDDTKSEASTTKPLMTTESNTNHLPNSNLPSQRPAHKGIFETDFIDKLSSKPYLNYHNPYARDSILTSTVKSTKKIWGRMSRNDTESVNNNDRGIVVTDAGRRGDEDIDSVGGRYNGAGGGMNRNLGERPKGVPRRIRILSIDVPELREVFDGECRVNLTRIYPDGIAPPKVIKRLIGHQDKDENHSIVEEDSEKGLSENTGDMDLPRQKHELEDMQSKEKNASEKKKKKSEDIAKLEVLQKSLARSLVRCRNAQSKRIGVEILEASVYDLNPHNMRRTYQLGSYRYNPGEYRYGKNRYSGEDDMLQRRKSVGIASEQSSSAGNRRTRQMVVTKEKAKENSNDSTEGLDENGGAKETKVLASDNDELDAPWNQYAWIEEMQLRINGRIPFGSSVERSSFLSRIIFGNCYRRTVKPCRSFLRWFIPSFLSREHVGGEEGIDGDYGKNGRTINRASSKPHAVIADGAAMQRVPGALRYLTKCCAEADIPLFIINDPRIWGGNTHSDLEGAAKDMRKTLKARIVASALTIKEGKMFERGRLFGRIEAEAKWQMKDVGRRTRDALQDASARVRKERNEDWSKLNAEELMQQLVNKKVIYVANETKGTSTENRLDAEVTASFAELCRRYVVNMSNKEQKKMEVLDVESKVNDGSVTDNSTKVENVDG